MANAAKTKKERNRFLLRTKENADFNQYWYSPPTIKALAEEVEAKRGGAAFLSTPSVYFTVSKEIRKSCKVFDYDTQWEKDPGFVKYDFNKPDEIPAELHHTFTMVVIDPPFITQEVWEKYAAAAELLLVKPEDVVETKEAAAETAAETAGGDDASADGKEEAAAPTGPVSGRFMICSTIAENADMMAELMGVRPVAFKPSIPNLVYQYNFYTNFPPVVLSKKNPEIPDYDD